MSKFFLNVLLVVAAFVGFSSCDRFGYNEEEEGSFEYGHTSNSSVDIIVASQEISLSSVGGDSFITFSCNNSWILKTDAEWLVFSKEFGLAGTQSVNFNVLENVSYNERSAKIIISSGNLSKEIKVVQKAGSNPIMIDKTAVSIGADGGMVQVGIKAIVGYTVEVTEGADWISPAVSTDSNVLAFEIAPNTGNSARDGEISIINKENSNTIKFTVHQD